MTLLHCAGLTVRYGSGPVLGPLDLSLDAGIVHLRGANGSGKTSLLRALCAAIPRHAGEVRVLGGDPEIDPVARGRIGFVPARLELPGFLTVDEAWRWWADLRRADCEAWNGTPLREAFDLPGDLPLAQASTGMRRKAEVLAALAGDPPVVLFDETLANLDAPGVDALCRWLDHHRTDRVCILTHHGALPLASLVPDQVVDL